MTDHCSCGAPATRHLPAGWVNRGGWVRLWLAVCEACAVEEMRVRRDYEMEKSA